MHDAAVQQPSSFQGGERIRPTSRDIARRATREPATGGPGHQPGQTGADRRLQLFLASAHRPTFAELTRCDWGTHVTVRGQPAKFNQAGLLKGRQIVIVMAHGRNDRLQAHSWHDEPADGGENAYYFDYEQADLRIGAPPAMPLLREQAASSLRCGDAILLNDCPAIFLELKPQGGDWWLTLRPAPERLDLLRRLGAEQANGGKHGNAWRLRWGSGLQISLADASLPTFAELSRLRPGTRVTIGANAVPGHLECTYVRDGTRQFVMVQAAAWLSLHQSESRPAPASPEWVYRIRFEEAGLRLA